MMEDKGTVVEPSMSPEGPRPMPLAVIPVVGRLVMAGMLTPGMLTEGTPVERPSMKGTLMDGTPSGGKI